MRKTRTFPGDLRDGTLDEQLITRLEGMQVLAHETTFITLDHEFEFTGEVRCARRCVWTDDGLALRVLELLRAFEDDAGRDREQRGLVIR
jgi:hypothetical protein